MAFTKEKLAYLNDTKAAIKAALIEKGQTVTDADTFRSYADKVRAIETAPEVEVYYVTFIGADGSELYVKPCVVGDDCYDPVVTGALTTPTKESTASQTFTHSGWSLTADGAADAAALQTVTADRTVYAAFTASTRYYTVNFYDGDSLLESQSVAYGNTPTITNPEKSGYSFEAWEPAIAAVTGDADYYAKWAAALTFAGGSWADIAAVSEAGEAENYFSVGDTRKVETNDGVTRTLRIIGFNHDNLADGSGKAGMTIACESVTADTFDISDWSTLSSNMSTVLKPRFPSDLTAHIKSVTKECDVGTTDVGTPINVNFEIFPLSVTECKIQRMSGRKYTDDDWTNCFTPLGTPYEYFAENYNATWYGPYGTFLGTNADLNAWYRHWFTAFASYDGVYHYTTFTTSSTQYCKSANETTLKPVLMAFCI